MENTTQVIDNELLLSKEGEPKNLNYPYTEMSFRDFLYHLRNIWLTPGGRISIGEYLLASIPFSVISSLIGLLTYEFLGFFIYKTVSIILALISMIMGIRLMVARLHDLNRSGRNVLWIILPILLLIIGSIGIGALIIAGSNIFGSVEAFVNSPYAIGFGILVLLLLIGLIGMIVLAIRLVFVKGTYGSNQYGYDPSFRQPYNNDKYIIIFLVGVASMIISMGLPKNQNLSMSRMQNIQGMPSMQGSSFDNTNSQNQFPNTP